MNLELMKKLEDLKAIYENLSLKINEQREILKNQYIQTVRADFERYFKEKDFRIESQTLSVTATYGSLVARLSHNEPDTYFTECEFVFSLDLEPINGNSYSIYLSEQESHSNVKVSVKNSKDTELQQEIESMQTAIKQNQNLLDNFSQKKWLLFVKINSSASKVNFSESYNSMYDILKSLIE